MNITSVNIITVDKSENPWNIEGEIMFEEDLTTSFESIYDTEEKEFEELILDMDPGGYDIDDLKAMIVKSAEDYE
jgi:hypothetical protein